MSWTGCISPIKKGNFQFACGSCFFCRERYVDEMSLRLSYELKRADIQSAFFVTLTYDNENLPLSNNYLPTLKKEHLKKFLETLKKYNKRHKYPPIKYYAVGEYGNSKFLGRPHYHLILINCTSLERITKNWNHGNVHIGEEVNSSSIGYIANYVYKEKKVPAFERDDREKEFRLLSNGIGRNYLTEEMISYHRKNPFISRAVMFGKQKKVALPRYYQNKIWNEKERIERAAYIQNIVEKHKELFEIDIEIETGMRFDIYIRDLIMNKTEAKKRRANQRKNT